MGRTGHLVEIVDILGDNGDLVLLFELGHEAVTLVRLYAPALLTKHIIEISNKCRVGLPTFMGGYFLHRIILPKAIGITKRLQAALDGHTGSG
jgi:hypothetical protein